MDGRGVGESRNVLPRQTESDIRELADDSSYKMRNPDAFREALQLEAALESMTRDDLVDLIRDMVERDASLMRLIEDKMEPLESLVDDAALRRRVSRAIDYRSREAVEDALWAIVMEAEELAGKRKWVQAGAACREVLNALSESYEDPLETADLDDWDPIADIAADCVERLGKCLSHVTEGAEHRQSWLNALLEGLLTDIRLGGVGFAGGASNAIIEHATEVEWPELKNRLIEVVPHSDDWQRETLVDLLVGWSELHGRDSEARRVIDQYGTPEQRAFAMLGYGRFEEAVDLALSTFPDRVGAITRLADALVESGAEEAARSLVSRLAGVEKSSRHYAKWLASYYRGKGYLEEALAWQRAVFMDSRAVDEYKALKEIAAGLGSNVCGEVLEELERNGDTAALMDIALAEKDAKRALELLPKVQTWWRDYRLDVAILAERKYPSQALALYRQAAEKAIAQRSRKDYARAAGYLKRGAGLADRIGQSEQWRDYVAHLRKDHARLRALAEELTRAGL